MSATESQPFPVTDRDGQAPATRVQAYAAGGPSMPFRLVPAHCPAPGPREVEIEVDACAVCHSDLHLWRGDWKVNFPFVPGHEIIGRVTRTGDDVHTMRVGQRVGVGWQSGACFTCAVCSAGTPQLCERGKRRTCVDAAGGLAERVVVDERFAHHVPDAISDVHAAPLMCAGLTVFTALKRHGVGPGSRVGIIGFGGLGHLAVQFASALGARVHAFDPDAGKLAQALACGAATLRHPSSLAELEASSDRVDFLLTTTPANLDWNRCLSALDVHGVLCLLGAPSHPLIVDPNLLLDSQRVITGSVVGSPGDMADMLAFAGTNGVRPMVEVRPMSEVNEAFARLAGGLVRYRTVLIR